MTLMSVKIEIEGPRGMFTASILQVMNPSATYAT